MTTYKVWLAIEEMPEDGDGQDVDLPDPVGEFDTLEEAQARVREILSSFDPESLEMSDHRIGGQA
jgi:hypothetical protein